MKPLTPSSPHVIILIGVLGAGKTQFGDHFAKTFQAPFINEQALQAMTGTDEKKATQLTIHLFSELLKTQRTFIYEGSTHQRIVRQKLLRTLTAAGYKPLLVWVQTDPAEAKHRTLKQRKDLSATQYDTLAKRFQPPLAIEKPVVISGKHTYATQVKSVLKHLAGPRADHATAPAPRASASRSITVR